MENENNIPETKPFYSYNDILFVTERLLRSIQANPEDPNNYYKKGIQDLSAQICQRFDDEQNVNYILRREHAEIKIVKAMDIVASVMIGLSTDTCITDEEKELILKVYRRKYNGIRAQFYNRR